MTVESVIAEVEKDMPFYKRSGGGVTLSGGEPFLQADFTGAILNMSAEKGIHATVDTSGYTPWRSIKQSLPYIDLFLYDLKHTDPVVHKAKTGVSNEVILENLQKLLKSGKNIVVSLPLIPGFNTSKLDMEQIAVFAARAGVKNLRILPYHRYGRGKYKKIGKQYGLENVGVLAEEDVAQTKIFFEKYIPCVTIGG